MTEYTGFGLHDRFDPGLLQGKRGHMVAARAIGHDPTDVSGEDFSAYVPRLRVIVRLQHGWGDGGCIPRPELYGDFAVRAGNYARATPMVHYWIVGNEFNLARERPQGLPILPAQAAQCFVQVERAIHAVPGHEQDVIMPGAIGPWNVQTPYTGNESGDWLQYQDDMLESIIVLGGKIGALCVHTYARTANPADIDKRMPMQPPYQDRSGSFLSYEDTLLNGLPEGRNLHKLPVYITETNPIVTNSTEQAWPNVNKGLVQAMYANVKDWNEAWAQTGAYQIKALVLFRYLSGLDQYGIADKPGVLADLQQAIAAGWDNEQEGENPVSEQDWYTVLQTGFDREFVYYNGDGHLMVPPDWVPLWQDGPELKRPEWRPKVQDGQTNEPEVYSPPYSAAYGMAYTKWKGALAYRLIGVKAGQQVRVKVMGALVSHHDDGQVGGELGQMIGLVGSTDQAFTGGVWGDWKTTRDPGWEEGLWQELTFFGNAPDDDPWLVLKAHADLPFEAQYAIWDDVIVHAAGDDPDPQPQPPTNGNLQEYIDRVQAALDDLQGFVDGGSMLCLPL